MSPTYVRGASTLPQQRLNFFPEAQGHGAFRPTLVALQRVGLRRGSNYIIGSSINQVACGGCGATWTSDDGSFWVAQGETDEGIQELQEFEVSWISAEEAAKRRSAGVETGARTRQADGTLTVCEETGEGFCPLCGAALKGAPA